MDSVDTFHFFIFHLHQEFESQQVWIGRARAESCVRVPTEQDSSRESSSRVEQKEAPVKPRAVKQVAAIIQAAHPMLPSYAMHGRIIQGPRRAPEHHPKGSERKPAMAA